MRIHAIVENNKTLRPLEELSLKVGETIIIEIPNNYLDFQNLKKRNMARNIKIDPEVDISSLENEVNNEIL